MFSRITITWFHFMSALFKNLTISMRPTKSPKIDTEASFSEYGVQIIKAYQPNRINEKL